MIVQYFHDPLIVNCLLQKLALYPHSKVSDLWRGRAANDRHKRTKRASAQSRDVCQNKSIWRILQRNVFVSEPRRRLSVYPLLTITVSFCPYQGIEHQSIKRVAVRVLHHDVEESVQSVLQELEWQDAQYVTAGRQYNMATKHVYEKSRSFTALLNQLKLMIISTSSQRDKTEKWYLSCLKEQWIDR